MSITGLWHIEAKGISEAIKQLTDDSDRAAGIVAATIIDASLTSAIKSRLHTNAKIVKNMFQSSGVLGTFDSKISLAYLMGVLTIEGHRDLITIKKIRNTFAHHLEVKSFQDDRIRALCMNLTYVERYIAPAVEGVVHPVRLYVDGDSDFWAGSRKEKSAPRTTPLDPPLFHLSDASKVLAEPRARYIYSAMVFNILLSTLPKLNPPAPLV